MDRSKVKQLIITLIAVFIILYVLLVFLSSVFDLSGIKTEIAVEMTASQLFHKRAIILRDEILVKNTESGVVSFAVSDGDQVSKAQHIANIYNSEEDALSVQQISNLNKEIAKLKKLSAGAKNGDFGIDTINSQIDNAVKNINVSVADRKFTSAKVYSQNLSYLITERFLVTGKPVDIASRITALTAQRNSLSRESDKLISSIKAKRAGCFSLSTDGYEKLCKYSEILDITPSRLDEIMKEKPKKISDNVIGKIVGGVNWYIICEIDKEEVLNITANSAHSVTVSIPYASTEQLPASIVAVNPEPNTDRYALVVKCDYMNADLAKIRKENVDICLAQYKGIRVSKTALHDSLVTNEVKQKDGTKKTVEKTVQGVYVLYGNELQFKEVKVIYAGSDFVICDPEPPVEELFTGKTISLYDNIVVKGSDLKDGKIV